MYGRNSCDSFFGKQIANVKNHHCWFQPESLCVQEIDLKEPQNFCIFRELDFVAHDFNQGIHLGKKEPSVPSQPLLHFSSLHCFHRLCSFRLANTTFTTFASPPKLSRPLQPSVLSLPSQLRFATAVLTAFASLPLSSQLSLRYHYLHSFRFASAASTAFTAFATFDAFFCWG